jgi:hypothetical protein
MMYLNERGELVDKSRPAPKWIDAEREELIDLNKRIPMLRYSGEFLRRLTCAFDAAGKTWNIQRLEAGVCLRSDVQICPVDDPSPDHVNNLYNLAKLTNKKIILVTDKPN